MVGIRGILGSNSRGSQPGGAGQKSWVGLPRGFRTMGVLLLIIKFTIKKTHLYQHLDGFLMNLSSDVLIINHLMVFL
jgi:hypothetical protein